MGQREDADLAGESADLVRILCVDDDPFFFELVVHQLHRADDDIEVTTATNVEDGLAVVAEGDVECIVSDYEMPGTNGLAFLRAIREFDESIPFVLFTGRGSEEIASKVISEGVSDYLRKGTSPERYELLANRVVNLVETARVERELATARERYELIGRASADAFWDWDTETDVVRRSDGFITTFGYEPEEVEETLDW